MNSHLAGPLFTLEEQKKLGLNIADQTGSKTPRTTSTESKWAYFYFKNTAHALDFLEFVNLELSEIFKTHESKNQSENKNTESKRLPENKDQASTKDPLRRFHPKHIRFQLSNGNYYKEATKNPICVPLLEQQYALLLNIKSTILIKPRPDNTSSLTISNCNSLSLSDFACGIPIEKLTMVEIKDQDGKTIEKTIELDFESDHAAKFIQHAKQLIAIVSTKNLPEATQRILTSPMIEPSFRNKEVLPNVPPKLYVKMSQEQYVLLQTAFFQEKIETLTKQISSSSSSSSSTPPSSSSSSSSPSVNASGPSTTTTPPSASTSPAVTVSSLSSSGSITTKLATTTTTSTTPSGTTPSSTTSAAIASSSSGNTGSATTPAVISSSSSNTASATATSSSSQSSTPSKRSSSPSFVVNMSSSSSSSMPSSDVQEVFSNVIAALELLDVEKFRSTISTNPTLSISETERQSVITLVKKLQCNEKPTTDEFDVLNRFYKKYNVSVNADRSIANHISTITKYDPRYTLSSLSFARNRTS